MAVSVAIDPPLWLSLWPLTHLYDCLWWLLTHLYDCLCGHWPIFMTVFGGYWPTFMTVFGGYWPTFMTVFGGYWPTFMTVFEGIDLTAWMSLWLFTRLDGWLCGHWPALMAVSVAIHPPLWLSLWLLTLPYGCLCGYWPTLMAVSVATDPPLWLSLWLLTHLYGCLCGYLPLLVWGSGYGEVDSGSHHHISVLKKLSETNFGKNISKSVTTFNLNFWGSYNDWYWYLLKGPVPTASRKASKLLLDTRMNCPSTRSGSTE